MSRLRFGGKPPMTLPSPSQAAAPAAAWTLTPEEEAFQPVLDRNVIRTHAFRNLSQSDAPQEYLEAERIPGQDSWRLRSCVEGQGHALSALLKQDSEATTVETEMQKSRTVLEQGSFMQVLQKMAVFEFGTDTKSRFALCDQVKEDLGGAHFVDAAHAAGVVFDSNGHPSLTSNGRPVRDGQYPKQELAHAVIRQPAVESVLQMPAIIRASDITPVFQDACGMDNFESFTLLLQLREKIDAAVDNLETYRKKYFKEDYRDSAYVYDSTDWSGTSSEAFKTRYKEFSDPLVEGQRILKGNEGFKYIKDAIEDALNMGDIIHAMTQMQCFYHKEKKDVLVPTMKAALDQVDHVITNSQFDREKDKSIRGFVMAKHDINAVIGLVESLQKSTSSIAAAVQAEIDRVIKGAQAIPEKSRKIDENTGMLLEEKTGDILPVTDAEKMSSFAP